MIASADSGNQHVQSREWLAPAIFLVALGVRLSVALRYPAALFGDSLYYDRFASGLASGQGYVYNGQATAFWPIGYPAFLAVLYLVHLSPLFAYIVQAVLGAGTVLLVMAVAGLFFGRKVAAASGVL